MFTLKEVARMLEDRDWNDSEEEDPRGEVDNSDTDFVDIEDKIDGPLDYINLYQIILAFCHTAKFLYRLGPYAFKHKLKLFGKR